MLRKFLTVRDNGNVSENDKPVIEATETAHEKFSSLPFTGRRGMRASARLLWSVEVSLVYGLRENSFSACQRTLSSYFNSRSSGDDKTSLI